MLRQELVIAARSKSSRQILEEIDAFVRSTDEYRPLIAHSRRYARMAGLPAYSFHSTYREPFPSLHFTESGPRRVDLQNIVPKTRSELSIEEYNSFLNDFAGALSSFARSRRAGLRLAVSSARLELSTAIPGSKTRAFFETYLAMHPRSYHSYDVRRLDLFICAAARNHKCKVDMLILKRYLIEQLDWSETDATWCTNRISAGLEIIWCYRSF